MIQVIYKNEYERHKAALKKQLNEWGSVRRTAEQNVEYLQREISDLQDAYLDSRAVPPGSAGTNESCSDGGLTRKILYEQHVNGSWRGDCECGHEEYGEQKDQVSDALARHQCAG